MLWLYILPGAVLFIVNIILFTHTDEIENKFNINLSDVWDIKQMIANIPHENHFVAAAVLTAIAAALCVGCLFLWPVLLILAIASKD